MKRLFFTLAILSVHTTAVRAQAVIDLSKDPYPPSQAVNDTQVHHRLLLPADNKYIMNTRTYENGDATTPGQMMNATMKEGNIGSLHTTSSVYYDEQGAVKGSNTTFSIGGKK